MRNTLSAWRSTSTAPMYTLHSMPISAAAVALATPCWPAPVSATSRLLAHPLGQQRLAEHVVDLVRAGVVEVLALQHQADAELLAEVVALGEDRRAPGVVAQQVVELGAERRDRPTPRGTRPPAPGTPAPASRARNDHRTRRSGRWPMALPSATCSLPHRHFVVGPVVGHLVGAEVRLRRGGTGPFDERLHLQRILAARRLLDTGRHVDAPRLHRAHRVGDVVGVETAGEDQPRPLGHLADAATSRTPCREPGAGASTRIRSVPNCRRRRASGEPATNALITQRICSAHLGHHRRRLVTVQLRGLQAGPVDGVDHPRSGARRGTRRR